MEPLRKCKKCGFETHSEEDLELFKKSRGSKYGRDNVCKKCASTIGIEWAKNNKNRHRKTNTYHRAINRYKITAEEYEECMATSEVCEHCGTTETLCYDHDHETMEFRGILCRKCNSALGQLGDTLEDIERMVEYLKRNKK
jgi:hypothetical protein